MTQRSRSFNLALVVSAVLAISACDRRDDRTAGEQLDATVAKTEQAAERAKADIQREAADAKSALKQGIEL